MKQLTNRDIARVLRETAAFYAMDDVPFKPRAYENAALAIQNAQEESAELYARGGKEALDTIPGVGKAIALHIETLIKTGTFPEYQKMKKKMPIALDELVAVEGVGPKMVKTLWQKLKVRNLKDLEAAARAGKIGALPGFGEQSEKKILAGIMFLKKSSGRVPLGFAFSYIRELEDRMRAFPEIKKLMIGGSVRRRKETIGDIDILATAENPRRVMERFVALPSVEHVYDMGPTKTNVRLKNGLDADLRIVPDESWGAALNYFTGSKQHNIELRKMALKKGWNLSEYGLFSTAGGKKRGTTQIEPQYHSRAGYGAQRRIAQKKKIFIGGRTEEELYKKLGLRYIEPELREMHGELEASRVNKLPKLIGYNDLRGDLQVQTNKTDGEHSIEEMALAAEKAGLTYIAITDHTKSLAVTRGLDEKKLLRQTKEIEKINAKLKARKSKCVILAGAEVNIKKDGTLDIEDAVLQKLVVVGAAVHSHFELSRTEQTKRIIRAMENPNVDIIFHLTTRVIGKRDAIKLDIDAVIAAAKRTGTI
ncbi:MAG: DNA polymerase III, partial [Candidatus Sungbacteria bacterium RIFCSPHIGHO2_02_FULL_47_11]